MTIIVTQSNAANFPSIPNASNPSSQTQLPGVYEAWPIGNPWTVDLTFVGQYTTGGPFNQTVVNAPVTSHTVIANPNNLFEYADVNYTQLANNSMRVYGPAINAFRDSYYQFQLEYDDAVFGLDANGNTIELDPVVLPNQNNPNLVIDDDDFVMPPRQKGQVKIVDTGVYGGVIALSLPRYFVRKLKPNTTLPWISFVTFVEPSIQQITLTFDVECKYQGSSSEVTETVTISQTIYFSYELAMQYIDYISQQVRI